jgi:hypothetical protein
VAGQTTPAAASSTGLVAPNWLPMSVAAKPGQAEFTLIPSSSSSVERMRVIAFNAAFETR